MFEQFISNFLVKYLGEYIEGLDSNGVNYAIFQGNLNLTNLRLKNFAFDQLEMPIVIKKSHIGSLSAAIPWSSLGSKPIQIKISDVFVLIAPKKCLPWDEDYEKKVKESIRTQTIAMLTNKIDDIVADKQEESSWFSFSSFGNKVVNNFKIDIENVHIRFEDFSDPKFPIAFSASIKEFVIETCDEKWKPFFLNETPQCFYKISELQQLKFFGNMEEQSSNFEKVQSFDSLLPDQFVSKMKDLFNYENEKSFSCCPSGLSSIGNVETGRLKIALQRPQSLLQMEQQPRLSLNFEFDKNLCFQLNPTQYANILEISDYFTNFHFFELTRRFDIPKIENQTKKQPMDKWKKLCESTRFFAKQKKFKWSMFEKRQQVREEYKKLYKIVAKNVPWMEKATEENKKQFESLENSPDSALTVENILFLRKVADAEIEQEESQFKKSPKQNATKTINEPEGKKLIAIKKQEEQRIENPNGGSWGFSNWISGLFTYVPGEEFEEDEKKAEEKIDLAAPEMKIEIIEEEKKDPGKISLTNTEKNQILKNYLKKETTPLSPIATDDKNSTSNSFSAEDNSRSMAIAKKGNLDRFILQLGVSLPFGSFQLCSEKILGEEQTNSKNNNEIKTSNQNSGFVEARFEDFSLNVIVRNSTEQFDLKLKTFEIIHHNNYNSSSKTQKSPFERLVFAKENAQQDSNNLMRLKIETDRTPETYELETVLCKAWLSKLNIIINPQVISQIVAFFKGKSDDELIIDNSSLSAPDTEDVWDPSAAKKEEEEEEEKRRAKEANEEQSVEKQKEKIQVELSQQLDRYLLFFKQDIDFALDVNIVAPNFVFFPDFLDSKNTSNVIVVDFGEFFCKKAKRDKQKQKASDNGDEFFETFTLTMKEFQMNWMTSQQFFEMCISSNSISSTKPLTLIEKVSFELELKYCPFFDNIKTLLEKKSNETSATGLKTFSQFFVEGKIPSIKIHVSVFLFEKLYNLIQSMQVYFFSSNMLLPETADFQKQTKILTRARITKKTILNQAVIPTGEATCVEKELFCAKNAFYIYQRENKKLFIFEKPEHHIEIDLFHREITAHKIAPYSLEIIVPQEITSKKKGVTGQCNSVVMEFDESHVHNLESLLVSIRTIKFIAQRKAKLEDTQPSQNAPRLSTKVKIDPLQEFTRVAQKRILDNLSFVPQMSWIAFRASFQIGAFFILFDVDKEMETSSLELGCLGVEVFGKDLDLQVNMKLQSFHLRDKQSINVPKIITSTVLAENMAPMSTPYSKNEVNKDESFISVSYTLKREIESSQTRLLHNFGFDFTSLSVFFHPILFARYIHFFYDVSTVFLTPPKVKSSIPLLKFSAFSKSDRRKQKFDELLNETPSDSVKSDKKQDDQETEASDGLPTPNALNFKFNMGEFALLFLDTETFQIFEKFYFKGTKIDFDLVSAEDFCVSGEVSDLFWKRLLGRVLETNSKEIDLYEKRMFVSDSQKSMIQFSFSKLPLKNETNTDFFYDKFLKTSMSSVEFVFLYEHFLHLKQYFGDFFGEISASFLKNDKYIKQGIDLIIENEKKKVQDGEEEKEEAKEEEREEEKKKEEEKNLVPKVPAAGKIKFLIEFSYPKLVLPIHICSNEKIIGNLGKIQIENSLRIFQEGDLPKTSETISLRFIDANILSCYNDRIEDIVAKTSLFFDISFILSEDYWNIDPKTAPPVYEFKLSTSSAQVHLNLNQYQLFFALVQYNFWNPEQIGVVKIQHEEDANRVIEGGAKALGDVMQVLVKKEKEIKINDPYFGLCHARYSFEFPHISLVAYKAASEPIPIATFNMINLRVSSENFNKRYSFNLGISAIDAFDHNKNSKFQEFVSCSGINTVGQKGDQKRDAHAIAESNFFAQKKILEQNANNLLNEGNSDETPNSQENSKFAGNFASFTVSTEEDPAIGTPKTKISLQLGEPKILIIPNLLLENFFFFSNFNLPEASIPKIIRSKFLEKNSFSNLTTSLEEEEKQKKKQVAQAVENEGNSLFVVILGNLANIFGRAFEIELNFGNPQFILPKNINDASTPKFIFETRVLGSTQFKYMENEKGAIIFESLNGQLDIHDMKFFLIQDSDIEIQSTKKILKMAPIGNLSEDRLGASKKKESIVDPISVSAKLSMEKREKQIFQVKFDMKSDLNASISYEQIHHISDLVDAVTKKFYEMQKLFEMKDPSKHIKPLDENLYLGKNITSEKEENAKKTKNEEIEEERIADLETEDFGTSPIDNSGQEKGFIFIDKSQIFEENDKQKKKKKEEKDPHAPQNNNPDEYVVLEKVQKKRETEFEAEAINTQSEIIFQFITDHSVSLLLIDDIRGFGIPLVEVRADKLDFRTHTLFYESYVSENSNAQSLSSSPPVGPQSPDLQLPIEKKQFLVNLNKITSSFSFNVKVNFYNHQIAEWEPCLEPWSCQIYFLRFPVFSSPAATSTNASPQVSNASNVPKVRYKNNLRITSQDTGPTDASSNSPSEENNTSGKHSMKKLAPKEPMSGSTTLNINFTKQMIETIAMTVILWKSGLSGKNPFTTYNSAAGHDKGGSKKFLPYILKNHTGRKLYYYTYNTYQVEVNPQETVQFNFEKRQEDYHHFQGSMLTICVQDLGKNEVNISKIGKSTIVNPVTKQFCVVDIVQQEARKIITVHSGIKMVNHTTIPVKIGFIKTNVANTQDVPQEAESIGCMIPTEWIGFPMMHVSEYSVIIKPMIIQKVDPQNDENSDAPQPDREELYNWSGEFQITKLLSPGTRLFCCLPKKENGRLIHCVMKREVGVIDKNCLDITLHLMPPLWIENLLPLRATITLLEYSTTSKQFKIHANPIPVEKGARIPVYHLTLKRSIALIVSLETPFSDSKNEKKIWMNSENALIYIAPNQSKEDFRLVRNVTIYDEFGLSLSINLVHYMEKPNMCKSLSLQCPYWVVNNTRAPIEMHFGGLAGLGSTRAAGCGYYLNPSINAKGLPLCVSPPENWIFSESTESVERSTANKSKAANSENASRVTIAINNSKKSQYFSMDDIGTSTEIQIPDPKDQTKKYCIGVSVKHTPGDFLGTKIVTFDPRYMFSNLTDSEFMVKQFDPAGTETKERSMNPGKMLHIEHVDVTTTGQIFFQFRKVSKKPCFYWTIPVNVTKIGSIYIKSVKKKTSKMETWDVPFEIHKVNVTEKEGAIVISIERAEEPPFLFVNLLEDQIKIAQSSPGDNSSLLSKPKLWRISPNHFIPYCWDDPYSKKQTVDVNIDKTSIRDFDINLISEQHVQKLAKKQKKSAMKKKKQHLQVGVEFLDTVQEEWEQHMHDLRSLAPNTYSKMEITIRGAKKTIYFRVEVMGPTKVLFISEQKEKIKLAQKNQVTLFILNALSEAEKGKKPLPQNLDSVITASALRQEIQDLLIPTPGDKDEPENNTPNDVEQVEKDNFFEIKAFFQKIGVSFIDTTQSASATGFQQEEIAYLSFEDLQFHALNFEEKLFLQVSLRGVQLDNQQRKPHFPVVFKSLPAKEDEAFLSLRLCHIARPNKAVVFPFFIVQLNESTAALDTQFLVTLAGYFESLAMETSDMDWLHEIESKERLIALHDSDSTNELRAQQRIAQFFTSFMNEMQSRRHGSHHNTDSLQLPTTNEVAIPNSPLFNGMKYYVQYFELSSIETNVHFKYIPIKAPQTRYTLVPTIETSTAKPNVVPVTQNSSSSAASLSVTPGGPGSNSANSSSNTGGVLSSFLSIFKKSPATSPISPQTPVSPAQTSAPASQSTQNAPQQQILIVEQQSKAENGSGIPPSANYLLPSFVSTFLIPLFFTIDNKALAFPPLILSHTYLDKEFFVESLKNHFIGAKMMTSLIAGGIGSFLGRVTLQNSSSILNKNRRKRFPRIFREDGALLSYVKNVSEGAFLLTTLSKGIYKHEQCLFSVPLQDIFVCNSETELTAAPKEDKDKQSQGSRKDKFGILTETKVLVCSCFPKKRVEIEINVEMIEKLSFDSPTKSIAICHSSTIASASSSESSSSSQSKGTKKTQFVKLVSSKLKEFEEFFLRMSCQVNMKQQKEKHTKNPGDTEWVYVE